MLAANEGMEKKMDSTNSGFGVPGSHAVIPTP